MTQEFHLSITSLGSDRYLIRTEDAAAGVPVAESIVDWPVDDWLRLAQPALDDPIAGILSGKTDPSTRATALHQLGETLYEALLFRPEPIRGSWERAQGIAQNLDELLRFRLGLKDSRLQRLPWEVMHRGGHPLTTRPDLTFVRYMAKQLVGASLDPQKLPGPAAPIRVLMVVASPDDQTHLKLLKEVEHIRDVLLNEESTPFPVQIQFEVLEQPDRSALAQKLEHEHYQVLHYAGHSDLGNNGGDLSLVNSQTGLTEKLSGEDLAGLLVNNQVALTVFNSCRSGHTAGDDAEMDWRQQNLVEALMNRGVPSVIAMAERIPDDVAIAFTRLFYSNLCKGYAIDESLNRTRQGLRSEQHHWALPILYLQPEFDGYLKTQAPPDDELPANANNWGNPESADTDGASASVEDGEVPTATLPLASGEQSPETATLPLLDELEPPIVSADSNDVGELVRQLSDASARVEAPPMPAAKEETLVDSNTERAGMAIYETLPEVPIPPQDGPPTSAPPAYDPFNEGKLTRDPESPGMAPHPPFGSKQPQQAAESSSPLIWFALGLIGVVGVIGLGVLAVDRGADSRLGADADQPSIQSLTPSGAADVDTLVSQAERAIQDRRYGDARGHLELALTQELIGKAEQDAAVAKILPLVADAKVSDLLYVKGRITWQYIAQLGGDEISADRENQAYTLAQQARETWSRTEATSLDGRVARGFAHYVTGDLDRAIENWEAAIALHNTEYERRPDRSDPAPVDSIVLHAYAGLVMVRTNAANLNLEALAEDQRIAEALPSEQNNLGNESERELSVARETFLRLQELDTKGQMTPGQLQQFNGSPETWNNWLWTDDLLGEWQAAYREWSTQTEGALR